jgi:hypothetical protein
MLKRLNYTEPNKSTPPLLRKSPARDLCWQEFSKLLAIVAEWRELKAERDRRGK